MMIFIYDIQNMYMGKLQSFKVMACSVSEFLDIYWAGPPISIRLIDSTVSLDLY